MTKLMRAFAAGLIALALCQPTFAQTVKAPEYLNTAGTKVPAQGVVCIDPTTKNPTTCGGGGSGGSLSAQANAAQQTSTEGATTDPLSMNLARQLRTVQDDLRPASATISVVDSTTAVNPGYLSVNIVTGTPTNGSHLTVPVNGMSTGTLTVSGNSFTATIQLEGSGDGGVSYVPISGLLRGSSISTSSVTNRAIVTFEAAGFTHIRARATAYTSGTPTVQFTFSQAPGPVKVTNPIREIDSGGTDITNTTAHALKMVPYKNDGTVVDLSNQCIWGLDNATCATTTNPSANQLQTQTDTVMVGGFNVKEINGVSPLMGNGSTGTGSPRMTISSDNSPVSGLGAGATGSAVPPNAIYQGTSQSGVTKGLISCDSHVFYDGTTALKTLVAGTSGKKIYVCGWIDATDGTATNLQLTSGTGTDCVTTSVAVQPLYNLVANDRVGDHTAYWSGLVTLANADNLCGFASAANGHSFEVWYTVQ